MLGGDGFIIRHLPLLSLSFARLLFVMFRQQKKDGQVFLGVYVRREKKHEGKMKEMCVWK